MQNEIHGNSKYHIGRYLKSYEIIHHKDENPQNNNINNLEIYTNKGIHGNYHKYRKER